METQMTRIYVIGGTGYAGSNILAEAVERGHAVASISRSRPTHPINGVEYLEGSILDADTRSTALANADVVVVAVAPRGDMAGHVRDGIKAFASDAEQTQVRLGIIGGAGSLQVAEGGPQLFDTPDFPAEFYAEALEMTAVLDDLRAASERLDWFYLSPPAGFGSYAPGNERRTYRVGRDLLLTDSEGNSFIGGRDFGAAVLDEIERPAHQRVRFTVAY